MAGGPRKFSEKIALLNQKEAEANAAFSLIMDEVSRIVRSRKFTILTENNNIFIKRINLLFQRPGSGSQVDLATENFTETKNNSIVDVKT